MPGPPSDGYFLVGGIESSCKESSCGRRSNRPSLVQRRSNRSTISVLREPKSSISAFAVGTPSAERSFKHRYSFSTLFDKSIRSEEHTSELQSRQYLVCRLLLEK